MGMRVVGVDIAKVTIEIPLDDAEKIVKCIHEFSVQSGQPSIEERNSADLLSRQISLGLQAKKLWDEKTKE